MAAPTLPSAPPCPKVPRAAAPRRRGPRAPPPAPRGGSRWRHAPCLLLLRAKKYYGQGPRAGVDRERHPDPGVGPAQFLDQEAVREEIQARPTVLLRHAQAH